MICDSHVIPLSPESSEPLTTGLMWFTGGKVEHIRHTSRQEDRLKRWGWIEHDGNSYGKEKLIDDKHSVKLEISHIKNDVAIVNVTTKSKKKIEKKSKNQKKQKIWKRYWYRSAIHLKLWLS